MKPVPGSTGNIEKRSLMVRASCVWVSRWAQKPPDQSGEQGSGRLYDWQRRRVASVIGAHHSGEPRGWFWDPCYFILGLD